MKWRECKEGDVEVMMISYQPGPTSVLGPSKSCSSFLFAALVKSALECVRVCCCSFPLFSSFSSFSSPLLFLLLRLSRVWWCVSGGGQSPRRRSPSGSTHSRRPPSWCRGGGWRRAGRDSRPGRSASGTSHWRDSAPWSAPSSSARARCLLVKGWEITGEKHVEIKD